MVTYAVKLERSDDLKLPERADSCTEATFVDWCNARVAQGRLLAVDLFSGAGGLSHGISEAGWDVAAAVDHDPCALRTHKANFSGLALDLDLGRRRDRDRLVNLLKQVKVDLIAGGPPCQPFSRAGRSKIRSLVDAGARDPEDHRRELWRAFVNIVERVKPRTVLMENVPDMALGDDLYVVRQIVHRLEQMKYRTQVRLVDAWQYGVPQHRQRLILLARRDGEFTWPEPLKHRPTVEDAIWDLPRLGSFNTGGRVMPYRPTKELTPFAQSMRQDAQEGLIHDHMTRPVRQDDFEVFQMMDHKTLYSEIPEDKRRYKAETFDDKYKRLGWEESSRSITAHIAKDGYWYIHPEEHRTITVREAARIQTFPDQFRFAGTRSDAFRQIGNAVPPMLGKAAAQALLPNTDTTGNSTPINWGILHKTLAQWATRQERTDNWYLIPSADVTPIVALVAAVLAGAPGLGHAMEPIRRATTLSPAMLERIEHRLPPQTARSAIPRLRMAVKNGHPDETDQSRLVEAVALKPAELRLFLLLSGQPDLLPVGQGSLRVAARVMDSTSDRTNRMTAGRLDLARIVGAGDKAPRRAAAIRLLGATLCGPKAPQADRCQICPLRSVCRSAIRR
ncbi:DNA (cytosine-5-)-methyltransferase [Micromonospora sp. NPDC049048]|uniref:DNA cytosine methyltransferase n=1 Tax=Micromonospora sp. NPDC049048 TaxID=3364263 RepID=UPI00371A6F71